jgi:glycosyltransferase involved in cell wall biosynthesis
MVLETREPELQQPAGSGSLRVLLVCHDCTPYRGSEPATAWEWAVHLASHHDVWVICHSQFQSDYKDIPPSEIPARLNIIWVPLTKPFEPWVAGQSEHRFRLHYFLWIRTALAKAVELHARLNFDVVHHVGLGTISLPSPFWKLGVPLVWGPLGGGQVAPSAFRRYFGSEWRGEYLRSLRVKALAFLPSLRRAIRRSSLIFATNQETISLLKKAGAQNVQFLLDSGTSARFRLANVPSRPAKRNVTLIWCGKLEAHKALGLALEGLHAAGDRNIRLVVLGEGAMRAEWQALADRLGLHDQVEFLGAVPKLAVRERLLEADGLVFTSLRDSFGSIVLEGMSVGLPVLTLAHQGAGSFVPDDAGIKIPVTRPEETVQALGQAFRKFARNPEMRRIMSEASWNHSRSQDWEARARRVSESYHAVIAANGRTVH